MPNLLADNQPTRRSAPPRPPRAAPPRPPPRPSKVLAGVSAALLAAAIGLLLVEAIALVVWMAEPRSSAPLSGALRTGAAFWLLGHGGRLHLPAGTAGLIPLGLSAIFASLAARAGASVSRVRASRSRRRGVLSAGLAVAVPYGLIAAVVAGVASSGGLHVSPLTAGIGAFILALVGAAIGAGRELPMAVPKPSRGRALLAGVAVAGGALIAGAALLAAIVLLFHISDAAALAKPAKAGAVGGVGLLAIQGALAPNVITWSASYLLGPGFAIGAGTLVSPGHTRLGDVPAVPMLAALPSHAAAWPLYLLFLIPVGAGVLGGLTVVRRLPKAPNFAGSALLGAGVGLGVAVPLAVAAMLSGGPVTAGRLATVGPAALPVGLMALLEIGLPSMLAAVGLTWRTEQLRRRDPALAAAPSAPVAERITGGLRDLGHGIRDWRGLVDGIRRAPLRAGHGIVAGLKWLLSLPGLGVHWLFHGSVPRPARIRRETALPDLEPGKVSLLKAPHDPYELFRDSLDEEADEEPNGAVDDDVSGDGVDDFFDDADGDVPQVIDLTDEALDAGSRDESEGGVAAFPDQLDESDESDEDPADYADAASGTPGKSRRPHMPRRLRRKPKVIRLPD
jgi:hypothetical protein